MMADLKRCPFCGESPKTNFRVTSLGCNSDAVQFSVVCDKCGAHKTVELKVNRDCCFLDVEIAMNKVYKLWNTRMGDGE